MSKLEVDNGKLDFGSTAQSKKYIVKMACLMANSSKASVSRQLGKYQVQLENVKNQVEMDRRPIYIIHVRSQRPECQRGIEKTPLLS